MTSLIEELFLGNLNPNLVTMNSDGYRQAVDTVERNEQLLLDRLEGPERTLLVEMTGAVAVREGNESVYHFTNGFRMGARLMLDAMSEE